MGGSMSTILFLNGNIYTMDAARPRAQAMAIDGISGHIIAVGDNDRYAGLVVFIANWWTCAAKLFCPASSTRIYTCSAMPIALITSTPEPAPAKTKWRPW